MLGNISSLVDVKWFLGTHSLSYFPSSLPFRQLTIGLPFNDTSNLRLQIAEIGESVLDPGGYLLGLQVGNEVRVSNKKLLGHLAKLLCDSYFSFEFTVLSLLL